eukprot:403337902
MKLDKAQFALPDLKVGGAVPPAYCYSKKILIRSIQIDIIWGLLQGSTSHETEGVDKLCIDNDGLITKISLL